MRKLFIYLINSTLSKKQKKDLPALRPSKDPTLWIDIFGYANELFDHRDKYSHLLIDLIIAP